MKENREKLRRAILFFYSLGYSNKQIASVMDIAPSSVKRLIERSKKKVAIFKEMADAMVEQSLFNTATGYTRIETFKDKEGNSTEVEKYYPPQVQAQQFWLKNRKPHEWRDTRHFEFKKTLEKLGDNDLLDVAQEMGITIENIAAEEVPPVMVAYTKQEEAVDGGSEGIERVVTREEETVIPTDERRESEPTTVKREDSDDKGDIQVVRGTEPEDSNRGI